MSTDDNARCEQTDLLVDQCAHCKPKPVGPVWSAKYEGVCAGLTCTALIEVGQQVKWNAEQTRIMHAEHRA